MLLYHDALRHIHVMNVRGNAVVLTGEFLSQDATTFKSTHLRIFSSFHNLL